MRQNIEQIQHSVKQLATLSKDQQFIFAFLRAFGEPETTITRLKRGDYNRAKHAGEILLKRKIFFKIETDKDCYVTIDELKHDEHIRKNKPRFIIVADQKNLLAIDTTKEDTLICKFEELPNKFTFFLPLAGMEEEQIQKEDVVSTKAAENVAKLHDRITHDNLDFDAHALHVFFARLLFCFFAEDTDIFQKNTFTKAIASHTQADGSDLSHYISRLFQRLNDEKDAKYPPYLKQFPYTNGGLFDKNLPVPKFSRRSRQEMLACGKLNWRDINPDIFGSMMQAVADPKARGNLGMHYTSPENIMKIISPLFLDNLTEQLENAGGNKRKLEKLHQRLANLRIFDPACGSGNFLIIAYKKLRELEMDIFAKLYHGQKVFHYASNLSLQQFYGIEIDPLAGEIAKLSLYLAEHQMNLEFHRRFIMKPPTLPLKAGGNIVCANALRIDWHEVCPRDKNKELYVLGNPPYVGTAWQSDEQKKDKEIALEEIKNHRSLDYVACWFYRGAQYIKNINAHLAFVATNSISQGQQVSILWPPILDLKLEISFAYRSFKWSNKAKGSAGITCVIVGIRNLNGNTKYIFEDGRTVHAKNINPYLVDADNVVIDRHQQPIAELPKIWEGSAPRDDGNLLLEPHIRELFSKKFVRKICGSQEYINGKDRYCLWIADENLLEAEAIPEIKNRIAKVRQFRANSKRKGTMRLIDRAHQFDNFRSAKNNLLVVPRVSSEHRHYIPIGFLDHNTVISNLALAVYDPPIYLFAIISSAMHMLWVKVFGGKLKTDYRYSSDLCYNTFPVPELAAAHKHQLEECTRTVIAAREQHSEKTLAQLYDPDKMPDNLQKAHDQLDRAVEKLYQHKPFANDDERLACLLKLYSKMEKKSA